MMTNHMLMWVWCAWLCIRLTWRFLPLFSCQTQTHTSPRGCKTCLSQVLMVGSHLPAYIPNLNSTIACRLMVVCYLPWSAEKTTNWPQSAETCPVVKESLKKQPIPVSVQITNSSSLSHLYQQCWVTVWVLCVCSALLASLMLPLNCLRGRFVPPWHSKPYLSDTSLQRPLTDTQNAKAKHIIHCDVHPLHNTDDLFSSVCLDWQNDIIIFINGSPNRS